MRPARLHWMLVAGAAAGVLAAAFGLIRDAGKSEGRLPSDAIALVNGRAIARTEFERTLAMLASDRQTGLSAEDRRHVLDRLIEEELLVQRAFRLGIAEHDRKIRAQLVRAVIDSVVAESAGEEPAEEDLREFFQRERDRFSHTPSLRVRQIFVRAASTTDSAAAARANEATRRLRAGEDFEQVRAALGDAEIPPLPDRPLITAKLVEYIGPTATRTASELATGAISDPVRSASGFHILQVVERSEGDVPPYEVVRDEVLAQYRKQQADEALRRYLDELRDDAEIVVVDPE